MKQILLIFLAVFPMFLFSQKNLIVKYRDNTETTIMVSSLKKITFSEGDIFFNMHDGSNPSSSIASIRKLYLEEDIKTGIDSNTEYGELLVYPNPATDFINVKTVNDVENTQIEIFDMNGRLIKVIDSIKKNNPISILELPKGVYFLRVSSSNNTVKFIKE